MCSYDRFTNDTTGSRLVDELMVCLGKKISEEDEAVKVGDGG